MRSERRRVRWLLLAVLVPVLILVGVLASAVAGDYAADDRGGPSPALLPPASQAMAPPPATPLPAESPPPPLEPPPAPQSRAAPRQPAAPQPPPAPVPPPATAAAAFVPPGGERIDVGRGARGAAIFRRPGSERALGPVVIFLHGWVAIDPHGYASWIAHLVNEGTTVIYPIYQTKPSYDTISPLANVVAGVRAALGRVAPAPGRLVVAGHSAGAALAADYAAVAATSGLPGPAAIFSVFPGRKLRHLPVPIPTVDLSPIPSATRIVVFAGARDTAVGSTTAREIAADARHARVTLTTIRDDAVDDHSAPRRATGAAQRTFWAPLDRLIDETAAASAERALR